MHKAVDQTIQQAFNTIAEEQSNPTEKPLDRIRQFLDYMATNPDTVILVYASDMILNLYSYASFQTASKMRPGSGECFLPKMASK